MSPLFDECLGDINSWATGPGLLHYIPEFSSDNLIDDWLPRLICNSQQHQHQCQQNQNQDLQEQQFDEKSSSAYTTEIGHDTHREVMPDTNPIGPGISYSSGMGDFPHLVVQSGVSFPFPASYEAYENPGEFPAQGDNPIF